MPMAKREHEDEHDDGHEDHHGEDHDGEDDHGHGKKSNSPASRWKRPATTSRANIGSKKASSRAFAPRWVLPITRHDEIEFFEDGDRHVGTRYSNEGSEGRVTLTHIPVGNWTGVWGMQFSDTVFSAIGEEAFIPESDINSLGSSASNATTPAIGPARSAFASKTAASTRTDAANSAATPRA